MPENDRSGVVMSTRVRLARNFADLPFPHMASDDQSQQVINRAAAAIAKSPAANDFRLIFIKDNDDTANNAMIEEHLISPDLIRHRSSAAVLINSGHSISIMVGEEDHLRIQSLVDGCDLRGAYAAADLVDGYISSREEYAFSQRLGYLTACPSNLGTGMRASFMLHLPALTMAQQIEAVTRAVGRLGLTVRGFYGEGSKAQGAIYQLSNQVTLGHSEEEILHNLEVTADQVISKEMQAREFFLKNNEADIRNRLMRSFGILKYAYKIDSNELLQLWSDLRMAISMGVNTQVSAQTADKLLALRPAELNRLAGRDMTAAERDLYRAQRVKEILA